MKRRDLLFGVLVPPASCRFPSSQLSTLNCLCVFSSSVPSSFSPWPSVLSFCPPAWLVVEISHGSVDIPARNAQELSSPRDPLLRGAEGSAVSSSFVGCQQTHLQFQIASPGLIHPVPKIWCILSSCPAPILPDRPPPRDHRARAHRCLQPPNHPAPQRISRAPLPRRFGLQQHVTGLARPVRHAIPPAR